MRPRITPIKVSGQIVHGQKVFHFINKPIHILCLEMIKTLTPIGRVTLRKEEEIVYHTRAKVAS